MSGCGKIRRIAFMSLMSTAIVLPFLSSCSSAPKLDGFDNISWKSDTSGCLENRPELLISLLKNKKELMNKKDANIMEYLGKPDHTIFFARGRKTFIYEVEPGKSCPNAVTNGKKRSLRLDINALGRVELIYLSAK